MIFEVFVFSFDIPNGHVPLMDQILTFFVTKTATCTFDFKNQFFYVLDVSAEPEVYLILDA